jgi:hypothetical protein
MTGNGERDAVRAAGLRHGAERRRGIDSPRDFGVTHPLAGRDLAQRAPHAPLEIGTAGVERDVETERRIVDERRDLRERGPQLRVVAREPCLGEPFFEIACEDRRDVAQRDGTDPARARRDQHEPERGLEEAEMDLCVHGAQVTRARGADQPVSC